MTRRTKIRFARRHREGVSALRLVGGGGKRSWIGPGALPGCRGGTASVGGVVLRRERRRTTPQVLRIAELAKASRLRDPTTTECPIHRRRLESIEMQEGCRFDGGGPR